MQFVLHPLQSIAMLLRSLSTGLPVRKLLEYDRDFLEMIREGDVKFYRSADEAVDDILNSNVHDHHNQEMSQEDGEALST